MTKQERYRLACEISAVSVFRGVLQKKEMQAFLNFLKCEGKAWEQMDLFGAFVYSLAESGYCFSDFLSKAVYEDENAYIVNRANGKAVADVVVQNAKAELDLFSRLTALSAEQLCASIDYEGYIPVFENQKMDLQQCYSDRMAEVNRYGYGIFATAGMFKVVDDAIVPVEAADPIDLSQFIGYENERQKLMDNTLALVEGRPAANALLCGDAGTGKSSTVKACANYFYDQGVRLIEIRKDQLFSLSYVMGRIAEHPLKFIIFIDDLSFNKNDDCFSMLKAALEGSASAKAKNAVIYATSNRRHIVKETFSDRANEDDVHHSDTVQELMSLSDRFGLTIYFSRPAKKLYLDIVHELAKRHGVEMDQGQMDLRAEAFALARGSRSPRAAEHFIKSLL
ncbi:MAG: ATP-binding protein [Firmicutes bacterium]|nr:ATP-binding protein [Bacillota bacterium]